MQPAYPMMPQMMGPGGRGGAQRPGGVYPMMGQQGRGVTPCLTEVSCLSKVEDVVLLPEEEVDGGVGVAEEVEEGEEDTQIQNRQVRMMTRMMTGRGL